MNRQVPDNIAIVGNGNMARHMVHYFELVGQPYTRWFRDPNSASKNAPSRLARFKNKLHALIHRSPVTSLSDTVASSKTVLLLIPDDQIESFIKNNSALKNKTCVHFSGSLNSDLALGCHPLMTFGADLYDLGLYQEVPFVVDEGVDLKLIFPVFKNPSYTIKTEHKAIYHAYCVMAGNFSQMMWKSIGEEFENIGLPKDLMSLFLQQNTQNFIKDPHASATGPFVRGDYVTIKKHQDALRDHKLGDIYQGFCDLNTQPLSTEKRKKS